MRLNFLSHNGSTDGILQYKCAIVRYIYTRSGRRRVIHDSYRHPSSKYLTSFFPFSMYFFFQFIIFIMRDFEIRQYEYKFISLKSNDHFILIRQYINL